jgi:hypothetical protein
MILAMADSDTAFLWETEALRSSKAAKGRHEQRTERVDSDDPDWLTLREAADLTGIPVSTLRKWARRESVPTFLEETPVGQLRMVSLKGIQRRAEKLGRKLETTAPPPAIEIQQSEPEMESETQEPETVTQDADEPATSQPDIPEGTMLVPLDAWNKMLMQLGNLHEAGQQLADARERAVKAETESTFLRERLNEVRSELTEVKTNVPPPPIIVEPVREPVPLEPDDETTEDETTEDETTEDETTEDEHREEQDDELSSVDIPVRNLGTTSPSEKSDEPLDEDDLLTLPAYSLAMMKHMYTTWRGRPRR